MNIHNIKNPLEKILRRLESLEEGQQLHELDRQYLSQQLQEAYNALHDLQASAPAPAVEEETHPGKNSLFEFEDEKIKPEKTENSSPVKTNESALKSEPEVASTPQPSETELAPQKEESLPAKSPKAEKPQAESTEVEETSADVEIEDEEIKSLFEIKESTELSERLSRLPIEDIWTAMGLNERIFTQNELFQGKADEFKSTVQELNNCDDFAQAKKILAEGPISTFDWTATGRKNIAKNFIRLVKRKYS